MMVKKDFSLLDILQLLKIRWWIIILAALMFAGGGAVYSHVTYEPTYSSSVTVYVNNQGVQNNSASDEVSQVKWAKEVVNTYLSLLKTNDFMKKVATEYKSANLSDEWSNADIENLTDKIKKRCVYSTIDETSLFTFTVTTHDKQISYNVAKIFESIAPGHIEAITGKTNAISKADSARIPELPSNDKNLGRNTVMGFLIGAILSFLVILIIDIADVRIKDEEDLMDNYQIPLLGSVPNFESAKKRGYGYGKK